MQNFDIIKKHNIKKKSFRVAKIADQFDYSGFDVIETFKGSIDIPDKWNIGLIIGKSGTGKSTIIKKLWPDSQINFEYKSNCVIDDFDQNIPFDTIINVLNAVGFSSVPSWLKPYSVLSNGEKMRINLARAILLGKEIIVFDEFTSVIDREVAKMGSITTTKIIKKLGKKFIAVSCHFDIIEWLEPDWIFSTDNMEMLPRSGLQRPKIKIEIREKKGYWSLFRRYHYLNHEIHKSAKQYIGMINDKPIAFVAIINLPHSKIKPLRKFHRIVVLPDYQGIGIGIGMMEFIAEIYKNKNEYIGITTSLKKLGLSLMKNKKWKLINYGRLHPHNLSSLRKTGSTNRRTYSFKYLGRKKING